jgi:hypothetical protein
MITTIAIRITCGSIRDGWLEDEVDPAADEVI